jgi:hypothetical protein
MDEEEWTRHFDETTQIYCLVNKTTGEFSYPDSDSSTQPKPPPTPPPPDEYRLLSIIRSHGGNPAFKHWILFISPYPPSLPGTILNIEGHCTHYRYIEKQGNPTERADFVDTYPVGYIDTQKIEEVKRFARTKKNRNEDEYWGCQDWTWELVGELEGEGLLVSVDEFVEERGILGRLKGAGK